MSKIQVEHKVPRPNGREYTKYSSYPFADMKIGDSFFIEAPRTDVFRRRNNLLSAARHWALRSGKLKWKFSVRTLETGIRIWRTE